MEHFEIGETVVLSYVCTKAGVAYDPATSTNITTFTEAGVADVTSTAMTNDSVGHYHYDYQSVGKAAGIYRARVTATDGVLITITDQVFKLQ